MSSTHTSSDLSTTPTTSTNSLSSTSPTDSSAPTGDQSAAVHINNLYILTLVALVLVFVVTCCTVLMRRRDRRRLFTEAMTEGLIRGPRLPGPIPQLHDLKVAWGGPGWKDIMPVTADAIEASIILNGPTRPHNNSNTSSATTPTNENYNYNLNATDGGSVSADTKSAAASTVISATGTNQVRIDVLQVAVLIAMPDPAFSQRGRRNRGRLKRAPDSEGLPVAEKRSTEVEAGDAPGHEDDRYYDHDELPILMIGVARVSPGDCSVDSEVE